MSKKKDIRKNLKNRIKNLSYKYQIKFLIKNYRKEKEITLKKVIKNSIESLYNKAVKFKIFSKTKIQKKLKSLNNK